MTVALHGVHYAADVYVHGAPAGRVVGMFRRARFPVPRFRDAGPAGGSPWTLCARVEPPPHPGRNVCYFYHEQ